MVVLALSPDTGPVRAARAMDLVITIPSSISFPTSIPIDISTIINLPSGLPAISIVFPPPPAPSTSSTPTSSSSGISTSLTSSSTPSTSSFPASASHHSGTSTAILVGVFAVVGLFLLTLVLFAVFLCLRRRRARCAISASDPDSDDDDDVFESEKRRRRRRQRRAAADAISSRELQDDEAAEDSPSDIVFAGGAVVRMSRSRSSTDAHPAGADAAAERHRGGEGDALLSAGIAGVGATHGQGPPHSGSAPSPQSPDLRTDSQLSPASALNPRPTFTVTPATASGSNSVSPSLVSSTAQGYSRPRPDASSYFPPSFAALAAPDARYAALRGGMDPGRGHEHEPALGQGQGRGDAQGAHAPRHAYPTVIAIPEADPFADDPRRRSTLSARSAPSWGTPSARSALGSDSRYSSGTGSGYGHGASEWGSTDEAEYQAAFGGGIGAVRTPASHAAPEDGAHEHPAPYSPPFATPALDSPYVRPGEERLLSGSTSPLAGGDERARMSSHRGYGVWLGTGGGGAEGTSGMTRGMRGGAEGDDDETGGEQGEPDSDEERRPPETRPLKVVNE